MLKKVWGRVVSAVQGVGESVSSGFGRAVGVACAVVAFVQFAVMDTVFAADPMTLPDIGVDWTEVGTLAATAIGVMVAGLIGIKIALAIVNAGVRMLGRMLC